MKVKKLFPQKYDPFIVLYFFSLLYYPPLFSTNLLHIVSIIGVIYIICNKKVIYRFEVNEFKRIIGDFLLIVVYLLFVSVVSHSDFSLVITYLRIIIEIIPSCYALVCMCEKRDYKKYDFLNLLLITAMLQGIFSVIIFVVPNAQTIVLEKAITYGFDAEKYIGFLNRRYFGLSYNLVTYTPVVQGCCFILGLQLALNRKSSYYLMLPFILFSAIINSRSSFVIIGIGMVLLLLYNFRKVVVLRFITAFIILILFFNQILIKIKEIAPATYSWMTNGINGIYLFLGGHGRTDYFVSLTNWTSKLPKGIEFILGIGEMTILGNRYNVATDIGYINYLWMGGIIFLFLINWIFIKMIWKIYKKEKDRNIRLFLICIIISIIVFNIKMPALLLDEFTILILSICIYFNFSNSKGKGD